ncbi:AMP-binding protein [Streptomyces sp. NPDC047108]|uniref:AMP-binding protein n=1 Tax=Streptomyces sp. NPDC047108 TaxID=3155025 RepID=UPI0033EDC58F
MSARPEQHARPEQSARPEESAWPEQPATLAEFAEWIADRFGDLPALRFRRGDGWAGLTYGELRDTVRAVGRGLIGELGVRAGDRVAILGETRPEWTYAHLAVLAAGAVAVPVYPTAGEEEVAWVLGDSGAGVILCEDAAQAARIARIRGRLPALRHVLLMSGAADAAPADAADAAPADAPGAAPDHASGGAALDMSPLPGPAPLADLLARGAAVKAGDLASIVYTSGTTGPPKGCRLTHGNIDAVCAGTLGLTDGGPGDLTYLYLPLAHLLAQLVQFKALLRGGTLCYFGGRTENILAELAEVRPTHLPSVPRLFERSTRASWRRPSRRRAVATASRPPYGWACGSRRRASAARRSRRRRRPGGRRRTAPSSPASVRPSAAVCAGR